MAQPGPAPFHLDSHPKDMCDPVGVRGNTTGHDGPTHRTIPRARSSPNLQVGRTRRLHECVSTNAPGQASENRVGSRSTTDGRFPGPDVRTEHPSGPHEMLPGTTTHARARNRRQHKYAPPQVRRLRTAAAQHAMTSRPLPEPLPHPCLWHLGFSRRLMPASSPQI